MKFRQWDINPKTAEEINEASTIEGMRKRIQQYAYNDALTKVSLDGAYHRGLSGEDTMTLLAYNALCWREKQMDAELDRLAIDPKPPLIFGPFKAA